MSKFFSWFPIEQFHNVVKSVEKAKDLVDEKEIGARKKALDSVIVYKGKIKLHGQNGAINICPEDIRIQSRSHFLPENTPFGKLFYPNISYFKECFNKTNSKFMVIFGEFCGPKVQNGVALAKLKGNVFVIFSILMNGVLIIEPELIHQILPDLPKNFFILDWFTKEYSFNFMKKDQMQKNIDEINDIVAKIDQECPWTLKHFDIHGPGEGIVFYPVSLKDNNGNLSIQDFCTFVFKAKGESHRGVKNQKSVQVQPEKASDADKFALLMVTTPRLEQGLKEVGLDSHSIGKFINWIKTDVEKEGKDELEESGLEMKEVLSSVSKVAGSWYQNMLKSKK